jgi:hypothetical protein
MTIPNTARKAGPLLGTGSQTAWPFTFKVFAAGDVQVTIANSSGVETLLVLGTDYSVSLNANQETSPGGTVTYPISGSALPVGSVLAIIGDLDYDQPLDLPSGGNFSPTALENQLDRSTMQIQQLREEMNRTAKLPPTSSESVEALVDDLQRIADSADNLDTVADNIADINTVAADLNEPVSEINTVAVSIANVNTVGANITNVNTVAGISANVTTVAGIAANVTTVAGIAANVTAVAGNATNINAVAGNATNINAVAANETNIDAVAANEAAIDTVAGISANVTTVAGISADVQTVAANVADITNFADVYLGPKTSDPTLRNDGSALQVGDLYFNTVEQALRTYGGTQWVAGTAGTMSVQNFSGNGSTTAFTLNAAPASENNTQVYIGGVYQQKDQYSVSGTTLTFSSAPTSGTDNIEVVTISTLALGTTDAALVSTTPGTGGLWSTVQGFINQLVSSIGSSLIGFIQAGTGAVQRTTQSKLRDAVSVMDFGAKGDGVTDDTAAIQAAINYVRSQPNGQLYFPPNLPSQFYKTTAPLTCDGSIKIVGAGPNSVTVLAVGLSAGQYVLDFDLPVATNYFFQIQDITFRSNNGSPSALRMKNTAYFLLKNVQLYNVYDGVLVTGGNCFSNNFEEVHGYNIGRSTVYFSAFNGGGNYKFDACTFTGPYGFYFDSASAVNQMTFISCNFEQCVTNSFRCDGTIQGLSFFGCRTEGSDGNDFVVYPSAGNEVTGLSITGCYFTTDAGASVPVRLGGNGGQVRGFSICGNHVEYAAANYFVELNGEGESGVISGNYFNLTTTLPASAQRNGVVVFANENASGKCAEYWGAEKWGVVTGTWTPTDASGAGLTLAIAEGQYIKIGPMLHWRAFVRYPSTASGSGAAIGGLPYAMNTQGQSTLARAGASVDSHTAGINVGIRQFVASSTSFSFYDSINHGTARTNANLSGRDLEMSGFYKIA